MLDIRPMMTSDPKARPPRRVDVQGLQEFQGFHKRASNFRSTLRNFASAASNLSRSADLLSASNALDVQMRVVLHLFSSNAERLSLIQHKGMATRPALPCNKGWRGPKPWLEDEHMNDWGKLSNQDVPEQLRLLADSTQMFRTAVNDFLDLFDDAMDEGVQSFHRHLLYRARCLDGYMDRLESLPLRRYVNSICCDLGDDLAALTSPLSDLLRIGIPAIASTQAYENQSLVNITAVATIFTAVTATTVQTSLSVTTGKIHLTDVVNACWFSSLALSVGSAIISSLALSWRHMTYRSPMRLLPWWVSIWVNASAVPLVFLALSVVSFILGLIFFSFSSKQHIATSLLVSLFSACSVFGLVSVGIRVVHERYAFFRKYNTKKRGTARAIIEKGIQRHAHLLSTTQIPNGIAPKLNEVASRDPHRASTPRPRMKTDHRALVEGDIPTDVASFTVHDGRVLWKRAQSLKMFKRQQLMYGDSVERLQLSYDGRLLLHISSGGRMGICLVKAQGDIDILATLKDKISDIFGCTAWSPSSNVLFTSTPRTFSTWVHVVDENRETLHGNERSHTADVWSIARIRERQNARNAQIRPEYPAFLALKGGNVDTINHQLDLIKAHSLKDFQPYDATTTGDQVRLLVVGISKESPQISHLGPRLERQIIVYNTLERVIEHKTPTLRSVRYIDITKDNKHALISYEDKTPSELWQLITPRNASAYLIRERTYLPGPHDKVDVIGPSSFGGRNDEFVMSVESAGGVYIWNRVTGELLRHIRPKEPSERVRCVAWRPEKADMITMGTENGEVLLWKGFDNAQEPPGECATEDTTYHA